VYRFIYPVKDAYIYELNTNDEKNFGGDDTLVLKKDIDGSTLNGVSRILLKFDLTDISKSLSSGDITSPSYYLRLYEKKTSELSPEYQLNAYALSQSWDDGTGYITQDPNKRDGVSWKRDDESFDNTNWTVGGMESIEISMDSASKSLEMGHPHLDTGSRKTGGGVWYDEGGLFANIAGVSSQSFSYESPDINMNVTDIVNKWLDGTRQNEGFIIKWDSNDSNMNSTSQSQEDNPNISGDINFFSSDANSIYSPKIEVRWDDKAGLDNNYSLNFDSASEQSVTSTNDGTLRSSTISFWAKTPGATTLTHPVFGHGGLATGTFWFDWLGDEKPFLYMRSAADHKKWDCTDAGATTDNDWHHWLVYIDVAGVVNSKLYLDGIECTTSAETTGGSPTAWSSLYLGTPASGQAVYNGQLDEFAVYVGDKTTYSASFYNSGTPGNLMTAISTIGTPEIYYQLEEGSGNLVDSSGNGSVGTLVNAPTYVSDNPGMTNLGSSTVTTDGTKDNYLYVVNLRDTYRETEIPKIRVSGRERYQTKSVSTSKSTFSYNFLPNNKCWYSIIDVETGATLIPYGDNSKLSQDTTSNYFKLNLSGYIVNRLYRILIRIQLDDGRYRIFDDNFNFKVVS